jgi:hypothetical protein
MSSIFKPNYQLRQSMASIPRPFIWGPGLQWCKWMTSIPLFVVWGHEFSIKKGAGPTFHDMSFGDLDCKLSKCTTSIQQPICFGI